MNNLLGVLIGGAIDREDGDSGVAGAVAGYAIEGAIKAVAPLVVTFALGWAVQYAARRAIDALRSDPEGSPSR